MSVPTNPSTAREILTEARSLLTLARSHSTGPNLDLQRAQQGIERALRTERRMRRNERGVRERAPSPEPSNRDNIILGSAFEIMLETLQEMEAQERNGGELSGGQADSGL
jgi:hypothetical protein